MTISIRAILGRMLPRDMREWVSFFEKLQADHIKSGQNGYDSGVGFFLGNHEGVPKISVGNSAGFKFTWDGDDLVIVGTITATSGTIGGWTLAATYLESGSGANTVRLDSGGVNPAISAGSATPASAPFRVTQAGTLTATSATITGTVTATAGAVGGWTLAATYLEAGSGATTVRLDSGGTNPAISVGSATPASAPFRVTPAGVLTAAGATINGQIEFTNVQSFTPNWSGFSSDPSGTLGYVDMDEFVVLFTKTARTDTSNAATMSFSDLPSAIRPPNDTDVTCFLIDDGNPAWGNASIKASGGPQAGTVVFSIFDGTAPFPFNTGGFTNTGTKGIPGGFFLMWAK